MLSTQIGNRQQLTETCAANLQILKVRTRGPDSSGILSGFCRSVFCAVLLVVAALNNTLLHACLRCHPLLPLLLLFFTRAPLCSTLHGRAAGSACCSCWRTCLLSTTSASSRPHLRRLLSSPRHTGWVGDCLLVKRALGLLVLVMCSMCRLRHVQRPAAVEGQSILRSVPEQALTNSHVCLAAAHLCSAQVRRWMFFHTTTLSLMTALDGLAAAAEGALAVQPYKRSARWWQLWRRPPAPQQPDASTDSKTARKADVETGLQAGNQDGVRLQETADAAGPAQNSTNSSSGTKIELVSHSRLHSLTSLRVSSPQDPAAAAAAADAEGLTLGDAAAGPPSTAQQPLQPLLESGAAAKAASPPAGAAAGSPAAAAAGPSGLSARLKASLMRHTGWIRPWLPLALNVEQYKNLQLVAREVPAAFSSWAGGWSAVVGCRVVTRLGSDERQMQTVLYDVACTLTALGCCLGLLHASHSSADHKMSVICCCCHACAASCSPHPTPSVQGHPMQAQSASSNQILVRAGAAVCGHTAVAVLCAGCRTLEPQLWLHSSCCWHVRQGGVHSVQGERTVMWQVWRERGKRQTV